MTGTIEKYMIPCVNKQLFGIECLGCGAQRATALFFSGEFAGAFYMYPAIYTIILLVAVVIVSMFYKFRFSRQIKMGLIILNAVIIVISYFIKMKNFIYIQ